MEKGMFDLDQEKIHVEYCYILYVYQGWQVCLTNRPQFSMVYILIDHRNDVMKCSKLKWNYEPQASGFNAKFWTFYLVISIVCKSADHGNLWLICFLQ